MELDHDLHLVADRAADFLERFERRLQICRGDVDAVVLFRREIERPDLHGRDALREKIGRQFVGAVQEGVEVVVVAARRRGPSSLCVWPLSLRM